VFGKNQQKNLLECSKGQNLLKIPFHSSVSLSVNRKTLVEESKWKFVLRTKIIDSQYLSAPQHSRMLLQPPPTALFSLFPSGKNEDFWKGARKLSEEIFHNKIPPA